MDNFDAAVEYVLKNEGGYSNDPDDCETNFGISKRQYPDLDIKNLTKEDAIAIYRRDYWDKNLLGEILEISTATKILDVIVNVGSLQGILITQRALRSANWPVAEDGKMGIVTLHAINSANPQALVAAIRSEVAGHCRFLLICNPMKYSKFMIGWLARAYS